jgi:hypothetical protein
MTTRDVEEVNKMAVLKLQTLETLREYSPPEAKSTGSSGALCC